MQRKKSWMIWTVILSAVIILAVSYYYGAVRETSDEKPSYYSVILYQNADNEWETLIDGIRQAEEDFKVRVNYVTMGQNDTAQEQIELIKREAASGVSGILLAAVDSRETGKLLDTINLQVPLITVETGVENTAENYVNISADNYKMGQELGEKILEDIREDQGSRTVTIIKEYMERDSVELRYQGLVDTLEGAEEGIKVNTVSRQEGDFSLKLFIGTIFHESGPYLAALDKFCTAEAAAAWENKKTYLESMGTKVKIYGIGNTAQTVNDLDNDKIRALVYQNEFHMGYEGIRALVEKEKKGYFPDQFDIKYKLVTRDTLYEPQNERLLFPSI